ncbi:TlpA family protein disulfide reductase [Cellulomonas chengniuliangii]|uniref:Thioredoxin family protein n=1 Tax=Cellulomonas chengniuliangii TaxID=2968084 RepID=A0ABY5KUM3_9CELL|nr:thioredoxin family protein [Cellulomonas chengniuliangii]MCC2309133.1 thioredoxin family protein [Cellulomonas chengniuliangii]MCC2319417.1 thioredoxin family protein [Cellulomonas chengniuliangii]UUI74149.1 thioredoxin family protein [Cellulomonas chengniuliangii]
MSAGAGQEPGQAVLTAADLGARLGQRATFVQVSSAFCLPCRAARRVLAQVADQHEGVAHVEIDVADHLELGEWLGIRATPTVLVLDANGAERVRATGAPTLAQARAALARVIGSLESSSSA